MRSVKGFLYGHYDSRGGTTMVVAADRKEADAKYMKKCFDMDAENTDDEVFNGIAEEDFMFEAELFYPDTTSLTETDLEADGGAVVTTGLYTNDDFSPDFEERDFCDLEGDGPHKLEFVPPGSKPVLFAEGWNWPRWDDDAFSFQLFL